MINSLSGRHDMRPPCNIRDKRFHNGKITGSSRYVMLLMFANISDGLGREGRKDHSKSLLMVLFVRFPTYYSSPL